MAWFGSLREEEIKRKFWSNDNTTTECRLGDMYHPEVVSCERHV
jgi:hypothetical protein